MREILLVSVCKHLCAPKLDMSYSTQTTSLIPSFTLGGQPLLRVYRREGANTPVESPVVITRLCTAGRRPLRGDPSRITGVVLSYQQKCVFCAIMRKEIGGRTEHDLPDQVKWCSMA